MVLLKLFNCVFYTPYTTAIYLSSSTSHSIVNRVAPFLVYILTTRPRAFQVRGNAQKPRVHFMACTPNLPGQIYGMLSPRLRQILAEPLNLTPDQKLQRFRLPTRVSSGQGSSPFDAEVCHQRNCYCSRKNNYS